MTPPRRPRPEGVGIPATDPRARRGADGERAAAEHLRSLGFRIVEWNLRTRTAEIDLLVRRRRLWVAVEVKTRRVHPAPERCVTEAQRARLERALLELGPHLRPRPRALRVDVAAVRWLAEGPEVRLFPGTPFVPG